jgi:hypothetical protein
MYKFKKISTALQLIVGLIAAAAALEVRATTTLTTLQPGQFREINQRLQVNIVFVGYHQGAGPRDIDETAFLNELPQINQAVNRIPRYYGFNARTGVSFSYNYNLVYANGSFEDAFFSYLGNISQAQSRTASQDAYNTQQLRSGNVGQNYAIDAPSVEKWLANHADTMLGIDTTRYTIFFVNWYGRPDFKNHVYTKTDEPDPDSGFNFDSLTNRKLIAWGGTTPDDAESGLGSLHRIWFYDLSAGPEGWTHNWNVDQADLNGDGVLDVRMPPVWEYGNVNTYRPFTSVSHDLGLITRYVAIDMLFSSSPIYNPAISPPKLPTNIQLDINLFQMDPNGDGRAWINAGYIVNKTSKLQPLNNFTAELKDVPSSTLLTRLYYCWWSGQQCYGSVSASYTLSFYNLQHLQQFLDGDNEYEIPVYVYNPTEELGSFGTGGYADSGLFGRQSSVFVFRFGGSLYNLVGDSGDVIHEVGHHLGLSHPHDGYDFESNRDFDPTFGDLYFVSAGDESNTVMSYLHLNNDFSQFDRDNMNRYLVAAYINESNSILQRINASPRAREVDAIVSSADLDATAALTHYESMNYLRAATKAKSAYEKIVNAAAEINVQIEPQPWQADWESAGRSYKFVDNVADFRLNE